MSELFLKKSIQPRQAYLKKHQTLLKQLADEGQQPKAFFVGCSDSRVMPEQLLGVKPGEMFMLRNIANIIPPYVQTEIGIVSVLEYAVLKLHVPHIIICGHTDCGGIRGLDQQIDMSKTPALSRWLDLARPAKREVDFSMRDLTAVERHLAIVEQNVVLQMGHVNSYPFVQQAIAAGDLALHGWVYHLDKLKFSLYSPTDNKFILQV